MTIVIDYDNDAVRIGSDLAFANDIESKIIIIREVKNIVQVQQILCEVINAICEYKSADLNISLMKQDEGLITTIEEY